jgi:ankyrin repeat protein
MRIRFVPCLALACVVYLRVLEAAALEASPALIEAVKRGDRSAALELVAQRVDVAATEADGTTALHWAVRLAERALIAALLEAGADPNAANRYGMTPQHLAAINGDADSLRALLEAGADANAVLPEGETVLHTAARTGSPDAVLVLLEFGADPHAREKWYGETALTWAVAENHAEAARVLIEHGADPNVRSAAQTWERRRLGQTLLSLGEWTPLFYAARENAIDAARVLLEGAADIDATDPDGATALVIAIINAYNEFAAFLIDAGADPNIVDENGMGALYAAVDMHRLAVGHGRPNPRQIGLLDSADVVRLLLENGADPNARLSKPIMQRQHTFGDFTLGEGATPLLRAAKSGDIEVVRLLLEAGADPSHTMPNGATALMYAAGLGWRNGSPLAPSYDQGSDREAIETIKVLLAAGLDLNAQDDDGNTPLHAAVTGRSSEAIIRFLVGEAGADVSVRNASGLTPLGAVESQRTGGGEPAAALLRSLGVTDPGELSEPVE